MFFSAGCDLSLPVTPVHSLALVQEDLLPKAKELGCNTQRYVHIVLNHSRITQDEKTFLKNGVEWLNEEAYALFHQPYHKLSSHNRQKTLQSIANTQWGESWIRTQLGYLFEAMFSDPIYGSNVKEKGWRWLAFEGGLPRPKRAYL